MILTVVFLLSLLPPSLSLHSSSTLSIIQSTSTVCAISAGDPTHKILCTSLTNRVPFPIFPNGPFLSLSGGVSSFCALRPDSLTLLCFNSPSFSPEWVHTSSESISDISLGSAHVSALLRNGSVRFWWAGPTFPVFVPGSFSSLTSGGDFTCAIRTSTRKVECWGKGGGRIQSAFAAQSMLNLVAGNYNACGETTLGLLICTNQNFAPSAGNFRFATLALGDKHSCGIERARNSTVVCWGGDGVEYRPVGDTSVKLLVAGGNLTCGVTTGNLSVVCWVADPSNPMVTMLPLPKVLPGVCVKEVDQDRVCPCGIATDSNNFCSDLGVICVKVCPIHGQSPPPPLPQPSSRKKTTRWWWIFPVIGGVGFLIGVCSIIYCMWNGFCRQNKVYNSVQPTISAANGNGGPTTNAGSNNSGFVPSPRVLPLGSKSRIFRWQSSWAVMNRQRRGPSLFEDRAEQFSFSDLAAATKNFSLENKIGAGSFGTVYKGKLPDDREVAIKRSETSLKTMKSPEKESAFQSELSFLSRVHHKHLVGLVGYCDEREERLLVYEYMKNGALYDHLHSKSHENSTLLNSWKMRIKVLLGASRGIEYLHKYAVPAIIHRDIKSANILLDSNGVARVSDFGLSLFEPTASGKEHLSIKVAGTLGYMDPESYGFTVKSDVYSLGVVMLEVLTGKRAIFKSEDSEGSGSRVNIVDYAIPCIEKGEVRRVLDPRVGPPGGEEAEAIELVAHTALQCVSLEGKARPRMTYIVSKLEMALAMWEESHGSIEESHGSISSGSISLGSYG